MYLYVQPSLTSKILLNVNFYSFQLQRSSQTPTSTFSNFYFFQLPGFCWSPTFTYSKLRRSDKTPTFTFFNFNDHVETQLLLFSTSEDLVGPQLLLFPTSKITLNTNFSFFQLQTSRQTWTSHFFQLQNLVESPTPTSKANFFPSLPPRWQLYLRKEAGHFCANLNLAIRRKVSKEEWALLHLVKTQFVNAVWSAAQE